MKFRELQSTSMITALYLQNHLQGRELMLPNFPVYSTVSTHAESASQQRWGKHPDLSARVLHLLFYSLDLCCFVLEGKRSYIQDIQQVPKSSIHNWILTRFSLGWIMFLCSQVLMFILLLCPSVHIDKFSVPITLNMSVGWCNR